MNAIAYVKQSKLDPFSPDFVSGVVDFAVSAAIRGAQISAEGDLAKYVFPAEKFPLAAYQMFEPHIERVDNYPIFLQVDPTGQVPSNFPNYQMLDISGNATGIHTWETWKQDNYAFVDVSGLSFLPSKANTNTHLAPSQCSGVTIVDIATLKQYQLDAQS